MPCAPKSCRVLSAHVMRAKILPGFFCACHARRNLAGFFPRMSCAPKSCRVFSAHVMRAEILAPFVCARHTHFKKSLNMYLNALPIGSGGESRKIREIGSTFPLPLAPPSHVPGQLGRRPMAPQPLNNSSPQPGAGKFGQVPGKLGRRPLAPQPRINTTSSRRGGWHFGGTSGRGAGRS